MAPLDSEPRTPSTPGRTTLPARVVAAARRRFIHLQSSSRNLVRQATLLPYGGCPGLKDQPDADLYLISFPKSGRTWFRLMIGKYLATLHQHEAADYMELSSLTGVLPGMPRMAVIHDGTSAAGINWRARHLPANKRYYRDRLVALLVRDPRDTVVSYYFYLRRRQKGCPADLGSFLRDERYGIQKIVRFLNIWAANRAVPRGFLLVRYEDLHAEPVEQLSRYLSFAGVQWNEQAARRAVEYASFDNMRKMELGRQQNDRLTPADHADLTTFKTRRGVVGGYKDHLAGADLDYANDCMRLLDPVFGY